MERCVCIFFSFVQLDRLPIAQYQFRPFPSEFLVLAALLPAFPDGRVDAQVLNDVKPHRRV
jgi:hypothetical protein